MLLFMDRVSFISRCTDEHCTQNAFYYGYNYNCDTMEIMCLCMVQMEKLLSHNKLPWTLGRWFLDNLIPVIYPEED